MEDQISKIVSLLEKIGLTNEKSHLIVDKYLHRSCDSRNETDTFDCLSKTILNFLIECILNIKTFEKEIPLLINYLVSLEDTLTPIDYGRLLHLKSVKSWRIDHHILLAITYLNQSIEQLSSLKTEEARGYLARVHDTYGQLLVSRGLLIDGRNEFIQALKDRETVNDQFGKAITLGNLGRLSMQLGDFENAVSYLQQDLEIMQQSKDKYFNIEAQLLSTISMCYIELGEVKKAQEHNEKSYVINKETKNAVGLIFNQINDAGIALKENLIKEADEIVTELKKVVLDSNIHFFPKQYLKGRVLYLEASLLFLQKRFEEANSCFEKSLEIYGKEISVSPVERANLLGDYAQSVLQQGDTVQAGILFRKSLQLLDSTEEHRNREQIESEMKLRFRDSWILHSAGRFLGHEQISFLLEEAGKGNYKGEEKEVVVLFLDIRDFTAISEKLEPKRLLDTLNSFLSLMTKCVEHYGGFVDKFIGDSIMAVFSLPVNTPEGRDNDAEKAVYAALMMTEELKRFNRNLADDIDEFRIGIGIHTGMVTAGLIGSPQKRSYTVIGDVSNTASRLESMTKILGAQILVSKEVCNKLSENKLIRRPLGKYCPKGRDNFIEVFEIMGLDDGSPLLKSLKEEYKKAEAGLNMFYDRKLNECKALFNDLLDDNKANIRSKAYRLISDACQDPEYTRPENEWTGEIRLSQK